MKTTTEFKFILCILFIYFQIFSCVAQDTVLLKVHFLYGSKPNSKIKSDEKKWFGGLFGGHVGLELDSNKVLHFLPNGKFHYFEKKNDIHGVFKTNTLNDFWQIFGNQANEVKKATVSIPITQKQKQIFDSIYTNYLSNTPYDYAFIGMRCGSAAYDILGQMKVLRNYSHTTTFIKVFYPRKLRKILLKKANKKRWKVKKVAGSHLRIWEGD